MKQIIAVITIIILSASFAVAQEEALPISGYLQMNYTARTTGDDDYIIAEERLQLTIEGYTDDDIEASYIVKTDFIKDELNEEDSYDINFLEAYIALRFDNIDLRFGRQINTWGVGDRLFINDVFPKDWVSLLAGRPLEYLKIATTSAKIYATLGEVSAELVLTPFFEEDLLPDGERLYHYSPQMPEGVTTVKKILPERDITNSEVSLKVSAYLLDSDVSLYAHRTHWRTPHMKFYGDTAEMYYPELGVYGATIERNLLGGVAKLEGGFYHSLEDKDGTDPLIKNSEQRYLAGFDKELFTDFNIGLQYYTEIMTGYEDYKLSAPEGTPLRDEARQVASLSVRYLLLDSTMVFSIYTQYSPSDEDYYFNSELKYNITDELFAAVGANIFGGEEEHTMFGQFAENDNIYTQLRYSF